MKTIGKSKIYMLVAIMAVLVLSVGLSFCVWDTKSLESQINAGSALFGNDNYILGYDANSNNVADVGDTVWFGNYFQQANETTKTPLEWRVVDIRPENGKDVMYLLSVKIHVFGSFWGSESYFDKDGNLINSAKENQRYNDSTIRAWLNSLARTDSGTNFNGNNVGRRIFNGFYNEAFTTTQKNLIIGRTISGMSGSYYGDTTPNEPKTYATLTNEKVWLPSFIEVYGVNFATQGGKKFYFYDNVNDKQFTYFKGVSNVNENSNLILSTNVTAYAVSGFANYININATHANNYGNKIEGDTAWWRLRSPHQDYRAAAHVNSNGSPSSTNSAHYQGGVRPAICLEK